MPAMREPQRLMAFWKYDLFPFMLCGEVTLFHDDETVETKEYGVGNRFKVFKIIPYERGVEYKKKLDQLKSQHRNEITQVNKKFLKLILDEFPCDHIVKMMGEG